MKKKSILVAADGSKGAMAAVRYVAETVHPEGLSVHLFSVISPLPESFWDSDADPGGWNEEKEAGRWQAEQIRIAGGFLEEAKQVLVDAGITAGAVTTKIHRRERGIARDIAAEAQRGYDAVVLGRRGNNPSVELPIGNVATKIANTLHHFPVWIVGGPPAGGGVLVAMDCSDSALRALGHACHMLDPACSEICLFHVIREAVGQVPEADRQCLPEARRLLAEMNRKQTQRAETLMGQCFQGGVGKLTSRGFARDRVVTRVVSGEPSRAGALVREAKRRAYGTIVMGRQGVSPEEGFFMGQVCSKVLQLTQDTTVWIVS